LTFLSLFLDFLDLSLVDFLHFSLVAHFVCLLVLFLTWLDYWFSYLLLSLTWRLLIPWLCPTPLTWLLSTMVLSLTCSVVVPWLLLVFLWLTLDLLSQMHRWFSPFLPVTRSDYIILTHHHYRWFPTAPPHNFVFDFLFGNFPTLRRLASFLVLILILD
jgi:hypothetical protein